ncbi:MAG: MBL fold metallo-hydrolase [Candidatus Woesearchaeota archaeon]
MDFCVLGSGSSGNSFLISDKENSFLIDAGFSYKEINRRLEKIGIEINEIKAVFITHEHIDHIKGIEKLYKEGLNIVMTKKTFENSYLKIKPMFIEKNQNFDFFNFNIFAFNQEHDAADPVGYKISDKKKNKTISIMTDLGSINKENIKAIKESDAIALESNHDIDMLINGPYPYNLKQRILSNKGHLSNYDSALFLKEYSTDKLKNIFLSHLSKINNKVDLVYQTFEKILEKKKLEKVKISNQYSPTEIITL